MEDKVEKLLEERGQDIKEEWKYFTKIRLEKCESPIEKLFLAELEYRLQWDDFKFIWVIPQYKIKNYRVDFILYWARKENKEYPINNKNKSLIVELDSYLWHGSNPEQFTKEKERDRELQKEGWHIMRFSGREIFRNVEKCANEALRYLDNIGTEILNKELKEYEKNE